jgi:transposase InsO family protein
MAAAGLKAYQPRTFVPRTSDGRADAPSPNLLIERAAPIKPNEVWVSDFTYIACGSSFIYLCIVMDLYSRRVVGWSLADHMRTDLVTDALRCATQARGKTKGLIFHSDRGSQYASKAFRKLLQEAGIQQSMSARANPYHNAWSESVIGTLKAEMLRGGRFLTIEDARIELTAYIDGYYNTHRMHSSLNYTTPCSFEAKNLSAA